MSEQSSKNHDMSDQEYWHKECGYVPSRQQMRYSTRLTQCIEKVQRTDNVEQPNQRLGQRGDQHALPLGGAVVALGQQVVDLLARISGISATTPS